MKNTKIFLFSFVTLLAVKSFALTVVTDAKEIAKARKEIANLKLSSVLVEGHAAETFKLKNGEFQRKQELGSVRAEVGSETPILLVKDDSNKKKSVFFVLWTSSGGTGHWAEIKQVQLEPGSPKEIKSFPRITEDRPVIKDMKLVGTEIVLDLLVHGPSDPGCCASSPSSIKYSIQ